MTKKYFFTKFFNNIELFITNLFKDYLGKLNLLKLVKKKLHLFQGNRVFYAIVLSASLFLAYLLIPNAFNQSEIKVELKNQLYSKFNVNFVFSEKFNYKFLPRPHFVLKDVTIQKNQINISEVEKLKIYVSLNNLFSLKKMKINNIVLESANFNFNKNNYNFFLELLNNDFSKNKFKIKDSNIFFRNTAGEVLLINKIKKMEYFFDPQDLINKVYSDNEIFNIPYNYQLFNNKSKKKIFTKINIDLFKFQIENEFEYENEKKSGLSNFLLKRKKSTATYKFDESNFTFTLFDKLIKQQFLYKGEINLNPFYSNLIGNSYKLDLSTLTSEDSVLFQLLKTEIFNNKNLNFETKINANKINDYNSFINVILNLKIKEGLIDIDTTKFSWKNFVNFEISDSLIYVDKNQLILDGKLKMDVKKVNEVYKFLLTPKNFREDIKKIDLMFNFNLDQKLINIKEIKIDGILKKKLDSKSNTFFLKNDKLQNRIYLKNKLNSVMKFYAG